MKQFALATLAVASLIATSASAGDVKKWNEYQTLATKIASSIDKAPMSELSADSLALTKLSTKLLPAFIKKHPICSEYLAAALAAADSMTSLSLDAIESDYHSDGKLPPVKSASCYHAKDLLVHPATMVVLAKTQKDSKETRKQIGHELEEVIEHFAQVKQAAGI